MSWQLFHLNSKQGPRPQPLGPPEAIITNSIFFLTSPDIGKNVSVWTSDNMPTILTKGWQWPCTVLENFHQELSTEEELGALLINLSRTHKNRAMDLKLLIVLGIFHRFFWTPEFSMSWDILEDHFSFSRCILPIFAEQENENFCGSIIIWFPSAPSSRILWTRPSDPRTWNIFDWKTLSGEGTRKTCIFQQKEQEKSHQTEKMKQKILLKFLSRRKQFGKSWTYLNSSLKRTIRVCYIINASWICRVEKIFP